MCLFKSHKKKALDTTFAGLSFKNPAGIRQSPSLRQLKDCKTYGAGFVTLSPPSEEVLSWILGLQEYRNKTILAVNVSADLSRTFSLVYDFSDLIIIDPDLDHGIDSPDISDTTVLLDDVVNLRLCYEHYTPIALRISHGHTPDEISALLDHCRLSGIDAVVVPARKVGWVLDQTQHRFPVIGSADTIEDALECLQAGASLVETTLRPFPFQKLLIHLAQPDK
jgi:hypothetical protein